ncbi:acyl carrier protein [Sphingosinithalassobacter portus]|uniref:acyl carrier protein n=1 Tax=Stakelama portus TaxID=2676234 RepID=UPI000D6EAC12|nr:hypothetical protein [Sphingosinithalassobacter portus]
MSVEREIRELIAEQSGMPLIRIHRDSRIAEDLGISGDDAVTLFSRISGRYRVDLTALWKRWDRHFLINALSIRTIVAMAVVLLIATLIAKWVGGVMYLPASGIFLLALLLAALIWLPLRRTLPLRKPVPIRVRDIVQAVERGNW